MLSARLCTVSLMIFWNMWMMKIRNKTNENWKPDLCVFYTLFLYHNPSGITYPFFAGGSCLLFFYFLKKSAPTAANMLHGDWTGRKYSLFITVCLLLLGFSVCFTDSLLLQLLAKLLLSLVYLIFCIIQIFYLFCGIGSLPDDYTYAEYAREGYFQLLFVCLFNIPLVLLCSRLFTKHWLLQALLSFICACTCLMIASSAYWMILYISAYVLTFLRVFVLWTLSVMILVLIGSLILIYQNRFPFVKYILAVIVVFFLLLTFSRPDAGIARYNLTQGYHPKLQFLQMGSLPGLSESTPVIFIPAASPPLLQ